MSGNRFSRPACVVSLLCLLWLSFPIRVDDATLSASQRSRVVHPPSTSPRQSRPRYSLGKLLGDHGLTGKLVKIQHAQSPALEALHEDFQLHAAGTQLYTAWNAPVTLKAANWYGFEYAPFVAGGLDKAPLDSILYSLHSLGFNALRITFADETVESNPVVLQGVEANPSLRGLHSLDILQRIIQRAHVYGLRVILCNSRSEAGRGPEIKTGLWYTAEYPESAWMNDWVTLVKRFRHDSAFVGADLRNEPHIIGGSFDVNAYFIHGPLWGAFHGTYYHDRDWHYAAQTLGNALLDINPHLLIVVEGVQMYLDPDRNVLTGGLWGSNLVGVQYDPIVLSRPGQLVYSIHEYGPHMWQGSWFNPHTTYQTLSRRWNHLWGYLLTASKALRAPIFVGEFGTCHEFWACVDSNEGWKQGFWFKSFVRYLHEHPQVNWAYWALNPDGPFHPDDIDFYSITTPDWKHYYPLITYGLGSLLKEPNGLWNPIPRVPAFLPLPGCPPTGSCREKPKVAAKLSSDTKLPHAPPPPTGIRVVRDVPYVQPKDAIHLGDLYIPQGQGTGLRPAVVVVHGGQFVGGAKGMIGTVRLARALAHHGYVAFDVNYRLLSGGGGYPNDILDIKDAVDFLATSDSWLHVDPTKIGIVGAGSGGYLAMMAGYEANTGPFTPPHYPGPQPRAAVVASLFAPISLAHITDPSEQQILAWYLGSTQAQNPQQYQAASPRAHVNTGISSIVIGGIDDPVVPFTQAFSLYKALRQRSHNSHLIDLPGAPHALTDLSWKTRHAVNLQITKFFDGVFYKPKEPQGEGS